MMMMQVFLLLFAGGLAIAVPGELSGHYAVWLRFGRVPWADLVLPTAVLCEQGFIVEKSLAAAIRKYETAIRNDSNFAYVDRPLLRAHYYIHSFRGHRVKLVKLLTMRFKKIKQFIKIVWQKAVFLPYMDDSINRSRQVASMRIHLIMLPWSWVHIPKDISTSQSFLLNSRQTVPILNNGPAAPFSLKIALSHGEDLEPHLTHGSLSPSESTTKTISESVQRLLQGSRSW